MFEQKIELEKTWQLNIKLDIEIASIAVVADCFARVSVTESAGEGWFCTTSSNFLGVLFDCKTNAEMRGMFFRSFKIKYSLC